MSRIRIFVLVVLAVVCVAAEHLVPQTAARTPTGAPIEEARPDLVQSTRLGLFVLWLGLAWGADRVPDGLFPLLLALPALAGGVGIDRRDALAATTWAAMG